MFSQSRVVGRKTWPTFFTHQSGLYYALHRVWSQMNPPVASLSSSRPPISFGDNLVISHAVQFVSAPLAHLEKQFMFWSLIQIRSLILDLRPTETRKPAQVPRWNVWDHKHGCFSPQMSLCDSRLSKMDESFHRCRLEDIAVDWNKIAAKIGKGADHGSSQTNVTHTRKQ